MSSLTLNVMNCSECGALYRPNLRNLCPACSQALDRRIQACVDYLHRNRKAAPDELSRATGVPASEITRFILEGKLYIADCPNMTYGCDLCGSPIRSGKLCSCCTGKLNGQIADLKKRESDRNAAPIRENGLAYRIGDRLAPR